MSHFARCFCLISLLLMPFFAASGISDKLKEIVESRPFSVDTDLLDVDLTDFINAKINIGVGVRRNRDKQTFSRTEEIKFAPKLSKNRAIDNLVFNSFINGESSVQFVRQFSSQKEAANIVGNKPYTLKNIPITAEKALHELSVGDYVRFKSKLNLGMGPSMAHEFGILPIDPTFSRLKTTVRYILSGDFQLEFYKIKQDKFLLRASTLKRSTFSASLAYQPTDALRIFAEVSDDGLKEKFNTELDKFLIPTTFASASGSSAEGNLLTVEYIYHFSNQTDPGAKAFEDVVNPENWLVDQFHVLKDTLASGTFTTDGYLSGAIIARMEESERLAKESLGEEPYDVKRNSRSSAEFEEKRLSFRMDFRVIDGKSNRSYVEQNFNVQDPRGYWKQYKLANLLKAGQLGFLKLLGRTEKREANAVIEMNPDGTISNFLNLHFEYSRDEKTQTRSELENIQQRVRRFMPKRYHDQMDLNNFAGRFIERDTRVDAELMFHEEAFDIARFLSVKDIDNFLIEFFQEIDDDHRNGSPIYGEVAIHTGQYNENLNWTQNAEDSIEKIRKSLLIAFASNVIIQPAPKFSWREPWKGFQKQDQIPVTNEERWEAIRKLRKDKVFFQLGAGIFARLLDVAIEKCERTVQCEMLDGVDRQKKWEDFAAFRLTATAAKRGSIGFTLGDYDRFQGIRNILRSRDRILGRKFEPEYFKFLD